MQLGVDFWKGGKPENLEKNPRSTGEINYDNSIHSESQVWDSAQMVTHPATDPVRPGLTSSLVVKGNVLTVYATRAPHFSFAWKLVPPSIFHQPLPPL